MVDIQKLIAIAESAGERVLSIYQQPTVAIQNQNYNSPVTLADKESHIAITTALAEVYPSVPILSEESRTHTAFECRRNWEDFFIIDPLDGTKEFLKKNNEFTINIALIKNQTPYLGVIYAPALNLFYYAEKDKGVFKKVGSTVVRLQPRQAPSECVRVLHSRSHFCAATQHYLNDLEGQGKKTTLIGLGSALKFGLIAEGLADIYPRFGPTMEWDTAAGDVLVRQIGKECRIIGTNQCLKYNKVDLQNPGFIVQ